jgi:hypothetical protein
MPPFHAEGSLLPAHAFSILRAVDSGNPTPVNTIHHHHLTTTIIHDSPLSSSTIIITANRAKMSQYQLNPEN